MELTAVNVSKIFKDCLFHETEIVNGRPNQTPVIGDGSVLVFGFHPQRIKENTECVKDMLLQLPPECLDSNKKLYAEDVLQRNDGTAWWENSWMRVEELIVLGMVMGLIEDLRLFRPLLRGGLFEFSLTVR